MTDLAGLLFYSIIGRIFIFLWMEFPLPRRVDSIKFFHDLHACDLCSGVYLYTILAWILKIDILQMMGVGQVDWIGGILTGGSISFLVHLIGLGWKSKFEVIIV